MDADLVERLRAPAYWFSGSDEGHEGENSAPLEAAARIEALEKALREIMAFDWSRDVSDEPSIQDIARAALEGKP